MSKLDSNNDPQKGRFLRAGLWLAQVLLAGVYLPTGIAAISLPVAQVSVAVSWAGHMPEEFLRFIGGVNLAAGLGILLPSVTRIAPRLTVLAAICSAALQGFVIFFHVLDLLPTPLPLSLAVIALSVFVAWGRSGKASIGIAVAGPMHVGPGCSRQRAGEQVRQSVGGAPAGNTEAQEQRQWGFSIPTGFARCPFLSRDKGRVAALLARSAAHHRVARNVVRAYRWP